MAVTVQSTASTGFSSNTVTITKPSSLALNDLMIACIFAISDEVDTASGWTVLNEAEHSPTGEMRASIQYKIADSGDVAASDFSFTTTSSQIAGTILRVDGFPASLLFSGSANAFKLNDSSGYDFSSFSVTPRTDNELIVALIASEQKGSGGVSGYTINGTNPTWTEAQDAVYDQGGGDYAHIGVAYATQATGAQITDLDATTTTSSSMDSYMVIGALSPQVAASGNASLLSPNVTVNDVNGKTGASGTVTMFSPGITVNDQTGAIGGNVWTNGSKNSTTWTNQAKV